ncbi:aldehyde dehydrogenase [Collinsella ihumii]|uniref:Aldehyde dehydrogenase n=1 Tax=Collinsella ihumii TaxID=1720204 RepID=A0AAW7JQT1_9ACTN|nr:aldehyde dehydrogenase [Collinsella ihumii]MDN0068732.1 aldehyde dehydrogenase [Collinsella ihumii]
MALIDTDLQSVQEARILLERAVEAQRVLEGLPEPLIDGFLCLLGEKLPSRAAECARASVAESDYGCAEDEEALVRWVLSDMLAEVRAETPASRICAGSRAPEVALSKGVAVSLLPDWLSVPTLISQLLCAVKSRSAIVFSARPRAHAACAELMHAVAEVAAACHYPLDAVGFLGTYAPEGESWLVSQGAARVVIENREGSGAATLPAPPAGTDVYRASIGNNPAFVEATADLAHAADEIVSGASFACGLLPGAEQSVVVEAAVADAFAAVLRARGCQFLSHKEGERLARVMFAPDGSPYPELIGKTARDLAQRADIAVAENCRVLVVERPYVSTRSVLSGVKYGPVISLYVEENWRDACEKCIELILAGGQGNALAIFSRDPEVIEQFIVKKPVGRVLVNVSTGLGGIGWHADLPRTLTMTGWERATTSELGVTYRDFIRHRQVGIGFTPEDARLLEEARACQGTCAISAAAARESHPSAGASARAAAPEPHDSSDWFSRFLESVNTLGNEE